LWVLVAEKASENDLVNLLFAIDRLIRYVDKFAYQFAAVLGKGKEAT
jgi:hypothetical protein